MKYIMHLTKNKTFEKKRGEILLKGLRISANLTQEQVSKITGLTIKFISEVENGRRNPSDKTKLKFAKAYRVKPVDIFLACQRTKCSKRKGGELN